MSTGNIYALIIGIDDYPSPVPKLQGCKNDANAIKAYLESRTPKERLFIKTLYDKEATRINILSQLEVHLGKAGKNDLALLYYVGHGSQEPAHEIFKEVEPDGKNETLVCWDSRIEDGMDLADKELATFIDLLAKRCDNVVTVFDCCHSGGVTREIAGLDPVDDSLGTASREVPMELRDVNSPLRQRPLDSYILSLDNGETQGRTVLNGETKYVVPNPRHVAISAALSSQTAKETTFNKQRRGVFTFNLVKILEETSVPMTYAEIVRRLQALVANKVSDQTPVLDVENREDANRFFLNNAVKTQKSGYILSYDSKVNNAWMMQAGELLGVKQNAKVSIFEMNTADVSNLALRKGTGLVGEITATTASIIPNFNMDTTQMYRAVVTESPIVKTQVFIQSDDLAFTNLLKQTMANSDSANLYIGVVNNIAQAEYIVYADKGILYIGKKADGVMRGGNRPTMPVAKQYKGYTQENASKLTYYLESIGKWENTADLGNPASKIDSSKIAVTFYQLQANDVKVPIGVGEFKDPKTGVNRLSTITFGYQSDTSLPRFQISIKNNTDQKLFVSLLLLSSQYGIYNAFKESGYWLKPGEEAFSRKGALAVPPEIRAYGIKEIIENYKVIASTEQFDITLLEQKELEAPVVGFRDTEKPEGLNKLLNSVQSRAVMFDDEEPVAGPTYDWVSILTQIKVKYNGV